MLENGELARNSIINLHKNTRSTRKSKKVLETLEILESASKAKFLSDAKFKLVMFFDQVICSCILPQLRKFLIEILRQEAQVNWEVEIFKPKDDHCQTLS